MAKGQKRSSREVRKPKQDRSTAAPAAAVGFANQMATAANTNKPGRKGGR